MPTSKLVRIGNGQMPVLGLGTWRSEPGKVKAAVKAAIAAGYRHIDCAWIYGNEAEVGEGLKESLAENGLKREDIWVTSKLWNIFHKPDSVRPAIQETLKNLQLEYLDLYLMHWPVAFQNVGNNVKFPKSEGENGKMLIDEQLTDDHSTTWKAMEALVDDGLTKNIGVSNFCIERLDKLLKTARIKPVVNQVELHPYLVQSKLVEHGKSVGVHLSAYSPLGSQDSKLHDDPVVKEIAAEHGVDPAAVLIAWAYARDNTSVLPKSVTESRIISNLKAIEINFSKEQYDKITALDKHERVVNPTAGWGVDIYLEGQNAKI
ncbi:Alcohol dehydrogenase [NADP(+)] [Savitreella phatthalungensis]